jgi:hypothetical protein
MDDEEIGRVWAERYPTSGDNRDALQMCGMICRLCFCGNLVPFHQLGGSWVCGTSITRVPARENKACTSYPFLEYDA